MWKPWWDFWLRLSGALDSLRGSKKRPFAALYRLLGHSKSPVRKCQRRMTVESLEYRKVLSCVVNIQPLIVTAGDVGELTVTVSGTITSPATVQYSVSDQTAVLGSDYSLPPRGIFVLQPGETSAKPVPVITDADFAAAANKSFTVSILDAVGAISLGTTQAQCTILEPDASSPAARRLRQRAGAVHRRPVGPHFPNHEHQRPCNGGAGGHFRQPDGTPFPDSSSNVSAFYQTVDGTATQGVNYCSASGWITIAANDTSTTIPVYTIDDGLYAHNDEYFSVQLSDVTGAGLGAGSAAVWVHNPEAEPAASISGPQIADEGTTAWFQISLSGQSNSPTTVCYDTTNGTATAGLEYVAASGSVTIAAGATTSESFPVTILDDGYEPNDDDFYTALDGASGASIAWGSWASVCVSIQNTDAEPCASVSGPQSVQEASTAWFQIALSGTSNATTSIYFNTVDGTATAGSEYVATCGSVTIAAGATTSQSIPVTIRDDGYEPNDPDFCFDLKARSGASLGWGSQVTVAIQNSDQEPAASVTGPATATGEGGTSLVSGDPFGQVRLHHKYMVRDGKRHGHRRLPSHVRLCYRCRGKHDGPDSRGHRQQRRGRARRRVLLCQVDQCQRRVGRLGQRGQGQGHHPTR